MLKLERLVEIIDVFLPTDKKIVVRGVKTNGDRARAAHILKETALENRHFLISPDHFVQGALHEYAHDKGRLRGTSDLGVRTGKFSGKVMELGMDVSDYSPENLLSIAEAPDSELGKKLTSHRTGERDKRTADFARRNLHRE